MSAVQSEPTKDAKTGPVRPTLAKESFTATITDKSGHTTKCVFREDGSVSIWQWPTTFEHTCDDDLIALNPAEAEELYRIFEQGLNRA